MAMDGVTIAGLVKELKDSLIGGRIYKIYQPEVDEICLIVKNRLEDKNISNSFRPLHALSRRFPAYTA